MKTHTDFNNRYITWECTSVCNYKCSYCWPEAHDGKHRWPDQEKTEKLIKYIKDFSDNKTVILDIMGGEPTLWPNLENFCHSVGEYSLITFSSNGSRSEQWWKKFTAPINHLIFSFHPEYADIDHYISILNDLGTRYRTTVFILYHPMYKEKCLLAWNKLTTSNLKISVKMKKIVLYNKKIDFQYTDEDKNILLFSYFNCDINIKNVNMNMFIDDKIVNTNELIALDKHSFTNWHCQLGTNYRYIKADGSIYGAACNVATPLGNVYYLGETESPKHVKCTSTFCHCQVDLILNNKCYTQE